MNKSKNNYFKRNNSISSRDNPIVKTKDMQSGITLIALVITIIILIILAGISINLVLEEDGILKKVKQTEEKTLIEQYKEKIELIKLEKRIEYENEITLEQLKNEFDNESQMYWVNKIEMIIDNDIDKIKLTTNDGYIFYITEETTEYKNKVNVEEVPPIVEDTATAEEILFTPEDTTWQTKNIKNVKQALDYLYSN